MNQPSEHLLELARHYLELVDFGTDEQQLDERTAAHNALIQAMLDEEIIQEQPNRAQVRWLARYFVQSGYLDQPHTKLRSYVMFVRRGAINPHLEFLPPFQEHEEQSALAFYIPVRVTIEPLLGTADNLDGIAAYDEAQTAMEASRPIKQALAEIEGEHDTQG